MNNIVALARHRYEHSYSGWKLATVVIDCKDISIVIIIY